jgi:predicted phage terminase large subunit-like protein
MEIEAEPLPEKFDEEALSWDMAFKDLKSSDYVAGGHWGRLGANKFLLKQKRAKLSFTDTLAALREMTAASPRATAKFVEDKANGTAVIDSLKNEIDGLIPIEPEGGKFARASAVSPQIEAGNVYLPHPALAPWVNDFIEEAAVFPNGRNDDWVDMTSQLLNRWQSHSFGALYRHVMTPDIFYDDATRPMQRPRPGKWVVIHVAPNGPRIYAQFLDDGEIVLLDREYHWDARREGWQKNDLEYADDLIHGCGEWPGLGNNPRLWPGVILHPEAVCFRVLLMSRGVWVVDAEEEKDDDVMRVSTMLAQKKLRINRRCMNIRRDLETMVWEDEKHSTSRPDCCRPYVATKVFNWRLAVNP